MFRANKSVEGNREDHLSPHQFDSLDGHFTEGHQIDNILTEFGDYGTTPPRTRISRRQRERRQREKEELW